MCIPLPSLAAPSIAHLRSSIWKTSGAFQIHLVAGGISWSALNQTVCALRSSYGVALKQSDLPERIPYAREPQKLPVVLRANEVVRSLDSSGACLHIYIYM
jgi:hypothetical protein